MAREIKNLEQHFKKMNTKRLEQYAADSSKEFYKEAKQALYERVSRQIDVANRKAEAFNNRFGVNQFEKIAKSNAQRVASGLDYENIKKRIGHINKQEMALSGELKGIQESLSKRYGRSATWEEAYVAYKRKRTGAPYSADEIPLDIEDDNAPELDFISAKTMDFIEDIFEDM